MMRSTILGFLVASLVLLVGFACSNGETTPTPSPIGNGSGGGGSPSAELVAVLETLPIFPKASDVESGKYKEGGSTGDNLLTGFKVATGTTLEEVVAFFQGNLPQSGWKKEAKPTTQTGDKGGTDYQTVVWSFLKDDVRLAIIIPLTHKDAPSGVVHVQLVLAPKEIVIFSTQTSVPGTSKPSAASSGNDAPVPSDNPRTAAPTTAAR